MSNLVPNLDFDQYGVNARGNTKRQEEDYTRFQSNRFIDFVERYTKLLVEEKAIKDRVKELCKEFKSAGFDVATSRKAVRAYINRKKRPDEMDTLMVLMEWMEKSPDIMKAIDKMVDDVEGYDYTEKDTYPNRLQEIGEFARENYRRAVEDLGYKDRDFEKEDLQTRAHFGDDTAKKALWEMDKQIAKEKGLPEPQKPDYILELEKPKEFTVAEINKAKRDNDEIRKSLNKLMKEYEFDENTEHWLDIKIPVRELDIFNRETIMPYFRIPQELRDVDLEPILSKIRILEEYHGMWFDYVASRLNPAMATVIPDGFTTAGDIERFGTTKEQSEKYLGWCRQFSNEEYIHYIDPNFHEDRTNISEVGEWRRVYVGGYPYPKDIVKKGHPDGLVAGAIYYPMHPTGDYTLERFDVVDKQPYYFRDPIEIGHFDKFRWIRLDSLRNVLDVDKLHIEDLKELHRRGTFGKDYYNHLINEQIKEEVVKTNQKIEASDEYMDCLLEAFKSDNFSTSKGSDFSIKLLLPNHEVILSYDFNDKSFKWERHERTVKGDDKVHGRGEGNTGNITYTDFDGNIISKAQFEENLSKGHLWDVFDLRCGYMEKDDEIFLRESKMNPSIKNQYVGDFLRPAIKNRPEKPVEHEKSVDLDVEKALADFRENQRLKEELAEAERRKIEEEEIDMILQDLST